MGGKKPHTGFDWLCVCRKKGNKRKKRSTFRALFLPFQNRKRLISKSQSSAAAPLIQQQHQRASHHRYWPLKTSTARRSPFSSSQRRNQGYFFPLCFYVKESDWERNSRRRARRWKAAGTRRHESPCDSFLTLPLRQQHNTQRYSGVWLQTKDKTLRHPLWLLVFLFFSPTFFQLNLSLQFESWFEHEKPAEKGDGEMTD